MNMLKRSDIMLKPDAKRTVLRPFFPDYPDAFKRADTARSRVVLNRILASSCDELDAQSDTLVASLSERHRNVEVVLDRRFEQVSDMIPDMASLNERQQRLVGAYFSEEYAFEAAALFNPSAVLHPEQDDVPDGAVRFIMSLRGIGEGHVSSVTFRTGIWTPGKSIEVDQPSDRAVAPIFKTAEGDTGRTEVELQCGGGLVVSETVLFPILPSQKQGIEDVRLTRFVEDDGAIIYHGTYTAFNGADARSELLSGKDFRTFDMRPMHGPAAQAKGMALFPRKIGGRYAMLGRQDNESIWLIYSDDLHHWDIGNILMSPAAPWEAVQIGNCGPPMEIDEGWLVLTHGVGVVRNYCMGACLLDRDDPSKVLKRTRDPILAPTQDERNGYVPNVVYSCGGIVQGRELLVPYGIADSFTSFATATVDDVLAMMD